MHADDRTRVRAFANDERWEEARATLDAIEEETRDVEWRALSAETEAGLGRLDEALALYDAVLGERPRNPAALYNRALVLSDLERHEDAVADLEDLVEVEGEELDVLQTLADEYVAAEFYVPALLAARRAESLSNNDEEWLAARTTLARALDAIDRREQARTALQEALDRWKEPSDARDEAAKLLASMMTLPVV